MFFFYIFNNNNIKSKGPEGFISIKNIFIISQSYTSTSNLPNQFAHLR